MSDNIVIAGREFRSRLFVGTGKYRSFQEMARCHEASGAEVVTVAVRRVNLLTGPRNPCSTTSTAANTSFCPTPRAATRPTTPSARRAWGVRSACPTG